MRRPGHHRPIGSLTAPSRFEWHSERQPQLGDITFETDGADGEPEQLRRAFLLAGIEETASKRCPYRLVFERLDWRDALTRINAGTPWWLWHKVAPGG